MQMVFHLVSLSQVSVCVCVCTLYRSTWCGGGEWMKAQSLCLNTCSCPDSQAVVTLPLSSPSTNPPNSSRNTRSSHVGSLFE